MTNLHMELAKAVTLEIGRLNQPVVTLYQAAVIISKLYRVASYKGEKINNIRKKRASRADCTRIIRRLTALGILEQSRNVRHAEVFNILGREHALPYEVVCSIDPFSYISHLSAMEWHGLTDRVVHTLFYSSPSPRKWTQFAWERMRKDIGEDYVQDFLTTNLPRLRRLNFARIGRTPTHRYSSDHLGAFASIQDRALRVSTIGRTFLDMVREPDLCGGIHHVLDVYEQYAPRFLKLIIDEIDRHGTKIDKVRVGYILDDRLNLKDERIDGWEKFTQRGGSRKLYAGSPYTPEYSEKWCLSINVEE